jgi:hypothetical protein
VGETRRRSHCYSRTPLTFFCVPYNFCTLWIITINNSLKYHHWVPNIPFEWAKAEPKLQDDMKKKTQAPTWKMTEKKKKKKKRHWEYTCLQDINYDGALSLVLSNFDFLIFIFKIKIIYIIILKNRWTYRRKKIIRKMFKYPYILYIDPMTYDKKNLKSKIIGLFGGIL